MLNPTATRKRRSRALWTDRGWQAVAAAFVFNGLLFGVWASRVPAFKQRFDLEPGTLGLLLLALAGGAIVSFPLAGFLSERWGAERLTYRLALGYGPALVLLTLAPLSLALGAALALFGAFHGAMDVAMNGWGAQVERRIQRSTMSIFHALFSLGAGLGAATGYVSARLDVALEAQFLGVAALGMIAALPLMRRAIGLHPDRAGEAESSAPLVALPSGALILVGLIAFASSIGEGAMADWSAVFLTTVIGAGEGPAALGYAVFSAMMVVTRLSGGVLVQRFGAVAVTRLSGAMAAVGLVTAILATSLGWALLGFALVGVGYAVVMPLVFSRAANDPTMRPGPAIASVATLGYGGMLLGPALVGFVAQVTSLTVSFGALAALALLPVFLGHKIGAPPRRA